MVLLSKYKFDKDWMLSPALWWMTALVAEGGNLSHDLRYLWCRLSSCCNWVSVRECTDMMYLRDGIAYLVHICSLYSGLISVLSILLSIDLILLSMRLNVSDVLP